MIIQFRIHVYVDGVRWPYGRMRSLNSSLKFNILRKRSWALSRVLRQLLTIDYVILIFYVRPASLSLPSLNNCLYFRHVTRSISPKYADTSSTPQIVKKSHINRVMPLLSQLLNIHIFLLEWSDIHRRYIRTNAYSDEVLIPIISSTSSLRDRISRFNINITV